MRHTPLGYRMVHGKVIINEDKAEIVRQIFKDYTNGLSQKAIISILSDQGIPSPTGKARWCQGSIRSILKNKKYIGDEYHPPIIEARIYEKAQERRKYINDAIVNHPKKPLRQPLSGKCICGKCRATYHYREGFWRCSNYIKDNYVKCDNHIYKDSDLLLTIQNTFLYLRDHLEVVEGLGDIPEMKTNMKINVIQNNINKARREEHLTYGEFRQLAYEKAQERFKISRIQDGHYQNKKIKNFLLNSELNMDSIKEIVNLIEVIELLENRKLILILCNKVKIETEVMIAC